MDEHKITITYDFKFSDLFCFALYHYTHSFFAIGAVTAAILVRNAQIISSALLEQTMSLSVFCINFFLDSVMMMMVLFALFPIAIFVSYYSKKNKIFTTYSLSLLQNSLAEESPYGKIEINYPVIIKTRVTKRHLFIYRTTTAAIIIPKRSFESETQWQEFYAALLKKLP